MSGNGLKKRIRPLISLGEQTRVGPNFRIEGTAAGVENSNDLPLHGAQPNGVVEGQAGIGGIRVFADDDFGEARSEHAALDDLDLLADVEDVGRNPAQFHIGVGARGNQGNGSHEHGLCGHERPAGSSGDAGGILNDLHRVEGNATGHF